MWDCACWEVWEGVLFWAGCLQESVARRERLFIYLDCLPALVRLECAPV